MFDMTCIIFAGGKSSRMGRDKSLLPFGGFETLAQYQYERLKKIFKRICISAKEADKFDFEADIIPDIVETGVFAPTAGFVSIFEHLDDDRLFVLSVDTPFVGESEISALVKADKPSLDAVVAKTDSGIHPMCGIYHRSLLKPFTEMLHNDNHRLGQLLKSSQAEFIFFDDDFAFTNLNHPHEYEKALLIQRNSSQ